jgi:hypothetical protein
MLKVYKSGIFCLAVLNLAAAAAAVCHYSA